MSPSFPKTEVGMSEREGVREIEREIDRVKRFIGGGEEVNV